MDGNRLGAIIIVSGPSGTGKSTICTKVRTDMPELGFSVSCTTRAPRAGEQHGEHYYFITKEAFITSINAGEFIEYAEVFGNFYGTLRSEVVNRIENGLDVFLDIDIQGAMQIKNAATADSLLNKSCEFIFIAPPSIKVLENRLRSRATDSEEQILTRLGKAEYELSFWKKYDYLVINDDLYTATEEMKSLIRMMRKATKRLKEGLFNA
ncbi:MAG: guanylate kinase [Victivallaceae bacterium]